ncbi:hypothetical protein BGZ52_005517, partial [Haplosporangium bisporale]
MLKTVKDALHRSNGLSKNQEQPEPSNIATTKIESPELAARSAADDSAAASLDVQQLQISTPPSPSTESSSPPSSPKIGAMRLSFKKIIGSFTVKEATVSPTSDSDSTPSGSSDGIFETEETVVTFSTTAAILVDPEPASSPSSSVSSISYEYPGTINAKMVKEHSDTQNLDGLKHALRAAIEKSSAAKESGRL